MTEINKGKYCPQCKQLSITQTDNENIYRDIIVINRYFECICGYKNKKTLQINR